MKTFLIGFLHSDYRGDETELDAETKEEALELFKEFCTENNFTGTKIQYVDVIKFR